MRIVGFIVLLGTLASLLVVAPGAVQMGIGLEPSSGVVPEVDVAVVKVAVASDVRLGEPELKVEGGELQIDHAGVSQQFSFGTRLGQRREVLHQFAVRGAPGRYVISARVSDARGETYESDSVVLQIREQTPQEKALDPTLHLRLPGKSLYVGEPLVAEVVLTEKPGTTFRPERGMVPQIAAEGFKLEIDGNAYRAEPLDSQQSVGFAARLTPLKAGTLGLSVTFEPQFSVRVSNRGIRRSRRYSLASEEVVIEVKPLPTEGRPADFSGAVGSFELELGADPLELGIGEPIALRLSITGEGNFDLLQAPPPTEREGWKFYNPTRMDLQRGRDGGPDRLVFAQNVVPLVSKKEIPPFRLTAFDPQTEQYVTLLTDPIAIEVSGGAAPASPPAIAATSGSGDRAEPPPAARPPTAELQDILTPGGALDPRWSSLASAAWTRPGFWWATGGLAAALIILAAAARWLANRSPSAESPSFRALLSELRDCDSVPAGEFYARASRCLQAWQREQANPQTADEHAEALEALRERGDFLQFGGNRESAERPLNPEEREQVLGTLRALVPQG